MSQDDTDGLLPSGFNPVPYEPGDVDFGLPIFPEAVWLAQMDMRAMDDGSALGLAYRLAWGRLPDDGEPTLDGELWLEPQQMQGIVNQYVRWVTNTEGD